MRVVSVLTIALSLPMIAADRSLTPVSAGNDDVEFTATVFTGRKEVTQVLGLDPGMEMIAVQVTVAPKNDKPVTLAREDFTLISRRDGQRSEAMHPSQIAGSGVLMVSSTTARSAGGGFSSQNRGPIWGGMPGTGTRPRRIGGDDANTAGVIQEGEATAEVKDNGEAGSPVLAALKAKELPLGERKAVSTGLLYFFFEGKHKVKHLELMYKKDGATLMLDFEK